MAARLGVRRSYADRILAAIAASMLSSDSTLAHCMRSDCSPAAFAMCSITPKQDAWVRSLHRFAVKGLGPDSLRSVVVGRGEAFPHDREWALLKSENSDKFDALAPEWLHKEHFECAFTAAQVLSQLETAFDDDSYTLTLSQRTAHRGSSGGVTSVRADLLVEEDVRALESFVREHLGGRGVKLVRGVKLPFAKCFPWGATQTGAHTHQFGNTRSGVRHNNNTRTIHIVNAATVAQVSERTGIDLDPQRFRANIIVQGLAPWEEFDWVGGQIAMGSAILDVISKTVRCDGVNVDLITGEQDCDLPALLAHHFPEHGPYLGVYAQVARGGCIACGDEVCQPS
jgi:uncharacterized protein YcbX